MALDRDMRDYFIQAMNSDRLALDQRRLIERKLWELEQYYNNPRPQPQIQPFDSADYLKDDLLDRTILPVTKISPKGHVTQTIPPLSENILVQFIGGPLNSEQKYYTRKEWKGALGNHFTVALQTTPLQILLDENDNIISQPQISEHADYFVQHIVPKQEFSESEIYICVFLPENT